MKNIGEYIQRGSEIIQVHSGKTNLKEIAASQYGWNLVQGLTNIPIKNKIADHISLCQSLSDVCKLVKQDKREMENREAFTGISVETEESVEEVNWRQYNYNNNATKSQQINEIDDGTVINEVENQEEGVYDQDYNEMDDISFPTSDLTEEEDQVYYYDD